MKNQMLISFIFLICTVTAQDNSAGYSVRYQIALRFGGVRAFTGKLNTSNVQADFRFREVNVPPNSISKDRSEINFEIRDSSEMYIHTNLLTKQLIETAKLPPDKNIYLVEDTIVSIDWKILSDTKKVNDHLLSKATGDFRGRKYIAWFAQDVPCIFGPWKFHGLPGLVFEIVDEKREVEFILTELSSNTSYKKINLPKGISISRSTYRKKQNALGEEIAQSLASKMGRGFTVEVKINQVKQIELD